MKNFISLFCLLFCCLIVFSQTKPKQSSAAPGQVMNVPADHDLDVYRKAISYGDYEVARVALFGMITHHPDSIQYLDSLVTLYFSLGQMPQCILAGNQYLQRDTTNLSVMEMVALSYGQLSKNKESLELYEKMYRQTGSIYYAYQTAVQQFYLKRVGECNEMIDIILKDPESEKQKIAINVDQNSQQHVPLKAAALNMRGIIFKEMNMKDKAQASFEEALKVMPDFALAKGNLDMLSKPAEEPKGTPEDDAKADKKK